MCRLADAGQELEIGDPPNPAPMCEITDPKLWPFSGPGLGIDGRHEEGLLPADYQYSMEFWIAEVGAALAAALPFLLPCRAIGAGAEHADAHVCSWPRYSVFLMLACCVCFVRAGVQALRRSPAHRAESLEAADFVFVDLWCYHLAWLSFLHPYGNPARDRINPEPYLRQLVDAVAALPR